MTAIGLGTFVACFGLGVALSRAVDWVQDRGRGDDARVLEVELQRLERDLAGRRLWYAPPAEGIDATATRGGCE